MGARLDAVLATATVADVLELAHVDAPRSDRPIRCPLPGHFDSSPSFSIQRSGRGFKCFGCSTSGGVLDLAVRLGLATDRGAAVDLLGELHRIPADNDTRSPREIRRAIAERRRDAALAPLRYVPPKRSTDAESAARDAQRATFRREARGLVPILDPRAAAGAAFLRRRGIEPDLADAAPVRFAPRWLGRAAVVFPVRDRDGRTIGAQGRYLDDATPKVRTAGSKAAGVFAPFDALDADVLALVEAPLCALSLAGCGLPAVAILGTSFAEWLPLVLGFRRRFVVIMTDSDDAGDRAAEKLEAALKPFGVKTERVRLAGAKDPNELFMRDPDELFKIADAARLRGLARLAGPCGISQDYAAR